MRSWNQNGVQQYVYWSPSLGQSKAVAKRITLGALRPVSLAVLGLSRLRVAIYSVVRTPTRTSVDFTRIGTRLTGGHGATDT